MTGADLSGRHCEIKIASAPAIAGETLRRFGIHAAAVEQRSMKKDMAAPRPASFDGRTEGKLRSAALSRSIHRLSRKDGPPVATHP